MAVVALGWWMFWEGLRGWRNWWLGAGLMVALGWWMFWEGLRGWRNWWLGAGLMAALSALVREPNALLFAPLLAGSMIRRDRGWTNLLLGGLAGMAGLELPRFRGHLILWEEGVHDGEEAPTIPTGVPPAVGRARPRGEDTGVAGSAV